MWGLDRNPAPAGCLFNPMQSHLISLHNRGPISHMRTFLSKLHKPSLTVCMVCTLDSGRYWWVCMSVDVDGCDVWSFLVVSSRRTCFKVACIQLLHRRECARTQRYVSCLFVYLFVYNSLPLFRAFFHVNGNAIACFMKHTVGVSVWCLSFLW